MFKPLFGKLGVAISFGLMCLLAPDAARADFPPTATFPDTGNFHARLLRDKGDVALVELSGNYDRNDGEGKVNIEPRTVIAKEFLRTHHDRYDFVVVFSNFEFDTKDATAFHIGVQNQVKGVGIDTYDNSGRFGSQGKLQGYIDMAALSRYVTNPFDARFDNVLQVFAHEFMHQWGAKAHFRLPGAESSNAMLGRDDAHWSFLLNSGASVEYGNQWRDNADGTFTSVAGRQFFSPLDLYLMGMYKKEEVPPFFLIDSPGVDKTRLPLNDVTVAGTRQNITIDDVIAAEGARLPDASSAQKEFRLGFVMLSRPGQEPTDAEVAAVNNIRRAIATRMAVLTAGRALVHSYLETKPAADGGQGTTPGGEIRQGGADVAQGMAWLRGRQDSAGFWKDNPFTTVRDTAVVFDTLSELDGTGFTGRQRALDWIAGQGDTNTDYLARQIRALSGAGAQPGALAARLLALQNRDGGWGVAPRYQSNPLDTALAMQALFPFESTLASGKLDGAGAFLAARQNPDGGWGNLIGGASRTAVSATVLQAMKGRPAPSELSIKAIAFLAGRQNADGGFGDSPSTIHDTANVMSALLSQNALGKIRAAEASAYIASSQQTDGSWDGSVYSTALAVRLLKSAGLFNWTASELKIAPGAPLDGQQTVLTFKVSNSGTAVAPGGLVRVYDGDPSNGGQQIGADLTVPVLLMGDSVELKLLWNTLDKAGVHTIVVQVDPGSTVTEASKTDNRVQANVTVRAAAQPVELAVNATDIVASPLHPNKLPTTVAISALVSNIGRSDAANVRVVLREGAEGASVVVDEKIINLLGRTQQVVNFAARLNRAGATLYTVVVDPDAQIVEADETNNAAGVTVETVSALDVEVLDAETSIARNPVFLGADATFNTRIHNAGTQDTPPFKVRYTVGGVEVANRTIQLAAGAVSEQEVLWRADVAGDLLFKVELDPGHLLAESDSTNNDARVMFKVNDVSGVNLSVSYKDFGVNPAEVLEQQQVTLTQLVKNTGNVAATDVEVGFYDGDPAAGRLIGPLQTIALIAPGASVPVSTVWTSFPDANEHLVFFAADPLAKIADVARDDNAAFIVVGAKSIADLAIAPADIVVNPELPRPGDALSVTATVYNMGKQAAANVVVRAYDGEPAQGGVQVGADRNIANFPGLSGQMVTFDYPASAGNAARTLVIVVDPDNSVAEKDEGNNRASRAIMSQSGMLSVSNRYFSPNGDGIKDDTMLGIRLQAATDVTVSILGANGKLVRVFGGDALKQVTSTSVVWDGLNQRGSVVNDGNYTLRVLDRNGVALGETIVTLDTNRSSIMKAADTPFGQFANLSCDLKSPGGWYRATAGLQIAAGDQRLLLRNELASADGTDGIYAMLTDGADLKMVLPAADFTDRGEDSFSASLDGTRIAYFNTVEGQRGIWTMDSDGKNKKLAAVLDNNPQQLLMNADGSAVLSMELDQVISYAADGLSLPAILFGEERQGGLSHMLFSPDRKKLLLTGGGDGDRRYFIVDLPSKRVFDLPAEAKEIEEQSTRALNWYTVWSPNSKTLAMTGYAPQEPGEPGGYIVWLFDEQFKLLKTFSYQDPNGVPRIPTDIGRPTWNYNSTEFAYEQQFCASNCPTPARQARAASGRVAPMVTTTDENDGFLMLADVASGAVTLLESTRVSLDYGRNYAFHWVPNERSVLRARDDGLCYQNSDTSCISAIDLDDNASVTPVFKDWYRDAGEDYESRQMRVIGFTQSGSKLQFSSSRDAGDSGTSCYGSGPDQYVFGTLLNLSADLRALRSPTGSGLILRGTAADSNFARYIIEYAPLASPGAWSALAPASNESVADKPFLTWVPPAYGNYLLRLTVEDLAGNKRQQLRQVTWTDTPPITDLYKDVEYISPNGDQAKDGMKLHYRVVEPVHLVFNVYSMDQTLVRSVTVDHPQAGEHQFVWDGLDGRGRQVRDGKYRVTVLDQEFFVTVDNEMPQLTASLSNAYTFKVDEENKKWVVARPELRWAGADLNLSSFVIESGVGETPAQWTTFAKYPDMSLADSRVLGLSQFAGMRYRAVLEDKAGNRIVVAPPMGDQQVFLTAYADHFRDDPLHGGQYRDAGALRWSEAATVAQLPHLDPLGSANPMRLQVTETVRKPVSKVIMQYKELSPAIAAMGVAELDSLQWEETLVTDFTRWDALRNDYVTGLPKAADQRFEFLWKMEGVKMATDYLMRVKLVDEDDAPFAAMASYVFQRDRAGVSLRIVDVVDGRPDALTVQVKLVADEPASRVDMFISSSDDPRFASERLVNSMRDVLGQYSHFLAAEQLAELDLRMCVPYDVRLRAVLASGQVIETKGKLPVRCIGAEWTAAPETVQACDATPSAKLQIKLMPFSKEQRRLTQLLFGQVMADGRYDVLNNWNDPVKGRTYAFDVDLAELPDGLKQYFVRVINEDGKVDTQIIPIPVAHAAPLLRITSPSEGQKVCGVPMRSPVSRTAMVNAVAIEASVSSDSNVSYGLEYALAATPEQWNTFSPRYGEVALEGFAGLREDPARGHAPSDMPPDICEYSDSPLCGDFHPVQWSSAALKKAQHFEGQPANSGTLGHLGLTESVDGEVIVRLRAFNGAGHQACSVPVKIDFDNRVRLAQPVIDRALFSPNAAQANRATVTITAGESVSVDAQVFAVTLDEHGQEVLAAEPIRTLAQGQQVLEGPSAFEWDGLANGAVAAADGSYRIVVTATDGCGNVATFGNGVVLDATAPVVELRSPLANGRLGLVAPVTGAVRDAHLASYAVEYATAAEPDSWQTLASGTDATPANIDQQLALWNTLGLTGPVSLRVRASDAAGNLANVTVALEVAVTGNMISYLDAAPAMLSPNGDGKRDSAAIRYGLLAEGKVTLAIHGGTVDGPLLRTLASEQLSAAGAAVLQWDGMDQNGQPVADGPVVAKLTFDAVGQTVVKQEESIALTVDTTKPVVSVLFPLADFAAPNGNLTISARDLNFSHYKTYLASGTGNVNWTLVGEGVSEQISSAMLAMSTLAEGKYSVKVVAIDQADNTTEVIKSFEIDATAPKVGLSLPLAGSYLSSKKGPVAIAGTVDELHLARYELRVGQGEPGPAYTELAAGTVLASPALAHAWDIAQVADGSYTILLSASDLAGQSASASAVVVVDNTAPSAQISAPASGAYVRAPGTIAGTAFDANLQQYTLDIAPGNKAGASRWSQLHSGTTPVQGGVLLDWQALPLDGPYTLKLKVTDKTGAVSEAYSEITVDTKAPAAPLNLRAKPENRNEAHLTWNASAEPDLAGYALYRNGVRINENLLTQVSYADLALANGSYIYVVKAVDKAGWESEASNPGNIAVEMSGPSAKIYSPLRGALISSLYDIRGNAAAAVDFKEYRLYVGAGESPSSWQLLRRSPAPVTTGVLASWNTIGVPENSVQTLKLEAEDIYGTIATDSLTVSVDNTPPLAPLALSAQANGASVTLSWSASSSPDLAGYIVLRDERIANAQGAVIGSWKPYLVGTTTHVDLNVADGEHRYVVLAMDKAENMSAPSNMATVTLDNRAPHAVMTRPLANAHIGRSTYLAATSPDTDVASVRFQYQRVGDTGWTDVGDAVTVAPFFATLDGSAFTPGEYLLQAVATDRGARTDGAPTPISVTFSETPDLITDLKARVDGDQVHLSWSSAATGLTGYVLELFYPDGEPRRLTLPPQANATYTDRGFADGRYSYRVSAVAASGQSNMSSDDVPVLVHTPRITAPMTPTSAATFNLKGSTLAGGTLKLLTIAGGNNSERQFAPDQDGAFSETGVPVPMGESLYELRHTDADGNVSKPARFDMLRAAPPAAPTGLAASADAGNIALTWNANGEADVIGYRIVRNGQDDARPATPTWVSSEGGDPVSPASMAVDGDTGTWWTPNAGATLQDRSLNFQYAEPTTLSSARVVWGSGGVVKDYDLQIYSAGGNWVSLAEVRGNTAGTVDTAFTPVRTTSFRVKLVALGDAEARLAELVVSGPVVQADTSLTVEAVSPTETFDVYAVNQYGMSSAPTRLSRDGDLQLADLMVDPDGLVVQSATPRVGNTVRFSATVKNQGMRPAGAFAAVFSVTDSHGQSAVVSSTDMVELGAGAEQVLEAAWVPPAPGQYTLSLALDTANAVLESSESNNNATRQVMVDAALAGAALPLQVEAPASGAALLLSWSAPEAIEPAAYRLHVGAGATGPFTVLAGPLGELAYRDATARNGERRYYMVTALDSEGNVIGTSAVVSGMARDVAGPNAPAIVAPATPAKPVSVDTPTVDIAGLAEPGASVTLLRAGVVVARVDALRDMVGKRLGNGESTVFDISDDGRHAVRSGANGELLDIEGGTVEAIEALKRAESVKWSHQGKLVALTGTGIEGWTSTLRILNAADRTVAQTSGLTNVRAGVAWSHDDTRIAVAGHSDLGEEGLWLVERDGGAARLLVAGDSWRFEGAPSWTPDGEHLAFVLDNRVHVVRTSDGGELFVEENSSSGPTWSADGSRLIYGAAEFAGRMVRQYVIADAAAQTLGDPALASAHPMWAGPEHDYIVNEDGAAVLRANNGSLKATVVAAGNYNDGQAFTLPTGKLVYIDASGELIQASLPGSFHFSGVRLKDGENLFTAYATDAYGNKGASSAAVSITLAGGALPDLAASLSDLVVLPNAPLKGEASRITAIVRNLGTAPAMNVGVGLTMRAPNGQTVTLSNTSIDRLDAGASRSIALDWTAPEVGQYSLALSLDPAATVAESNENNNVAVRTVTVAQSAVPSLTVTTDAASYGQSSALGGKVVLTNAGAQVSGTLTMRVEDMDGYLVEILPPSNVTLGYGENATYPIAWNTGAVLAGAYRIAAQLRDGGDVLVTSGTARFEINAARNVNASVFTAQPQYSQQQSAIIGGSVELAGGNASLDGASALITVQNAQNDIVFETTQVLGALQPGAAVGINALWPIGSSAAGAYKVKLSVIAGAETLATAQADVGVVVGARAPLSGSMTLSSATPANGERLIVAYTLDNHGAGALAALPLSVTIVDPDNQRVLAGVDASADVAPGATLAGEAGFDVSKWPLKTLQVVYAAQFEGKTVVLQRAVLRVVDRSAPVVAFTLQAQEGELFAGAATPIVVKASDRESLVASVEYALGSSTWLPFAPANSSAGLYSMSLAGMADGLRQIQARATDTASNVSEIVTLNVVIDNTLPTIVVAGVQDNGVYADPVSAHVTVSDANLQSVALMLDGVPYVSGTPISAGGVHTLQVDALDKAGNTAARSVRFELAQNAPVVAIVAPGQGAFVRTPLSVVANASGAGIALVEFQLDGGPWMAGLMSGAGVYGVDLPALADGAHALLARATDNAAQVALSSVRSFVVDNTAPVVSVAGVADGASYTGPVAALVTVSDANLLTSAVTLDGVAYIDGATVASVGTHKLVINASDKAGNTTLRTLQFQILGAPPLVAVTAPAQAAVVSRTFVFVASASSAASTIAKVEFQFDGLAWANGELRASGDYQTRMLSPMDGAHTLVARATDADGQVTVSAVRNFVVDGTAPLITVTGIADGGTYTGPVTPQVAVVDANPDTLVMKLDNVAYAPGQAIAAAGAHVLTVDATDKAGNSASKRLAFTVTDPVHLSVALGANPAAVQASTLVVLAQQLQNSGAALASVALELTITNTQTMAVVYTHLDTVALAANGSWVGDIGWTVSGAVGTNYLATLTAKVGGVTVGSGQAPFSVIAPVANVVTSTAALNPQRVLVLSMCKRQSASDPLVLAQCDSTRAQALGSFLDQIGVSYKQVGSEALFARELLNGGYNGYWVSAGGTKFGQPVQTELNAALRLGEGLLGDAWYNITDADKPLFSLMSVYATGTSTFMPAKVSMLGKLYPVGLFDPVVGERLDMFTMSGSTLEGFFGIASTGGGGCGGGGVTPLSGGGMTAMAGFGPSLGLPPVSPCIGTVKPPAIVSGTRGSGHTLLFGFDWVGTFAGSPSGPADGRWLDVGRSSFSWLAPVIDASAPLIAGEVITRKLSVHNAGQALTLSVVASLPPGAVALNASAGSTIAAGPAPSVTWQLQLAAAEDRDLTLQMKLPRAAGAYELRYVLSSVGGGATVAAGSETVVLAVTGLDALASTAQDAVNALTITLATDGVLRDEVLLRLRTALRYSGGGTDALALGELALAQTALDKMAGSNLTEAQKALARVIRVIERRL